VHFGNLKYAVTRGFFIPKDGCFYISSHTKERHKRNRHTKITLIFYCHHMRNIQQIQLNQDKGDIFQF